MFQVERLLLITIESLEGCRVCFLRSSENQIGGNSKARWGKVGFRSPQFWILIPKGMERGREGGLG